MCVYYQITPFPLCYSKLTMSLAKIWRRLIFDLWRDTLNNFKFLESWQTASKAVFLTYKNGHLISIQPFPQQSHWTKPSGDAPMYGISILITKPHKSQLKFPWHVCCSSMYISLALISYFLPWFKEATLMLELLYWPRICLIRKPFSFLHVKCYVQ